MITLANYQIISQLYESNYSLIFRGLRNQDQQSVILKMLKQDFPTPEQLMRYRQEYEVTKNLELDCVVKAYHIEKYQNTLVIILEDFGGQSLATTPEIINGLAISDFLSLAIQISDAVGQIHAANIIHKDINPANIIWNQKTHQLKIIDFSIATRLPRENPTLKNPTQLEGTLAYISPEQTGRMNCPLDHRTDLYSLGVTFYQLLTGQRPFESDTALELVHCHIAKTPKPVCEINPNIPPIISDIIMKLMAKNLEDRYQSAFGVKADLQASQLQLTQTEQITAFELAQNDFSGKFQMPQRLYGRDNEVNTLLQAFERISQGAGEMMLIAGYSGVGKTALVREIYQPMTAKQGYFAAGKFDQFQRNIPYSALTQAFNEFCNYLLTETSEILNQWHQIILEAVGNNGQVLIDVIGQLELIIGPQPAVAQLGPTETQNRFNLYFQNFFRAICQPNHPLVLFIDDLQWADAASLNLLEILMTDTQSQYFLIIGAYRDNEVEQSHPLTITLEKLRQAQAFLNTITLTNLSLTDVNTLIADTLHCQPVQVDALSELVYQKTQGNAFFTREFLKSLYQKELLTFAHQQQTWQWDINQLNSLAMTDNVIELIANKINQLPPTTQEVLKLAAGIGNLFELQTLAMIYQQSPAETLSHLWPALEEGLLFPLDNTYQLSQMVDTAGTQTRFKFQHDRIQQAAYSLIADADKPTLHLLIGRLLLTAHPESLENQLFEIVDHLNLGLVQVDNLSERNDIAQLNLKAGQKAKAATAYQAAVNYLDTGLTCLSVDSWENQYDLTLALHLEAVEANYLNINFEKAQQLSQIVLQQAHSLLEQIKIYERQIQFYSAQNQLQAAMDKTLAVLTMLGVPLSDSPPEDITISRLAHLPTMTDPYQIAAMRILMIVWGTTIIVAPQLIPKMAFTMVKICMNYGNSPLSAFSYAFYGLNLCNEPTDIAAGYQFGQLALQVLEQFETRDTKCRVHHIFNAFIRHWQEPARQTIDPLRETIQIGLETGDLEYTCYAAMQYSCYSFLVGEPLDLVNQKQDDSIELIRQLKQEFQLTYAQIWGQLAHNFSQPVADKQRLIGELFDETKIIEGGTLLYCLYLAKAMLDYFFKDFTRAIANASKAEEYEVTISVLLPRGQIPFYASLIRLALYPTVTEEQQIEFQQQIAANQQRLTMWAKQAPANYQHKYDLVEAEKARVLGEHWQAATLYEKAIAGAQENQYLHEEALAYELAAEFYLGSGMERFAQTSLKQAHYCYQQWGAMTKVEALEARYFQWLVQKQHTMPTNILTNTTTILGGTHQLTAASLLDLETVMKAAQTLSGEIMLERLLEKMMRIVIENAGAQQGFLLLPHDDQWLIEAEGAIEQAQFTVLQSLPIEPHLPVAIISYVARTQKNVVLANARQEGLYLEEPYIKAHQTQSVLCFPIVYQQKLRAILYLENNLTPNTFTPQRLDLLKMLSSQIAISLENAQVMAHLESKVEERTHQLNSKIEELTKTRQELVQSEKMASLGRLVAGFAHELNTPLGVAISSASTLQTETNKINHLMAQEEIDVDELLSALESVNKGANLTLSNLDRAANLVTSFKRTAVDQTSDEVIKFYVYEVINDTINTLHNYLKKTEIQIVIDCCNTLTVRSLPGALEQIITNLIMNSIIHGFNQEQPVGYINIKVDLDQTHLHFVYSDNGKGIAPENLAKIFEPFFTTERAHGGSGLGLYICYNLITIQLQGTITCDSTLGKGVVFHIKFPVPTPSTRI